MPVQWLALYKIHGGRLKTNLPGADNGLDNEAPLSGPDRKDITISPRGVAETRWLLLISNKAPCLR